MRWILLGLAIFSLASCHGRDTPGEQPEAVTRLCDVARDPRRYVGRVIVLDDVVIVDGHGTPELLPDSSCDKLPWFLFSNNQLSSSVRRQFDKKVNSLNTTTVHGHRAGLAGRYTVKVLRQREAALIELSLIDATDLRLADADSKSRAVSKQMGRSPPDFH
jgi:hypothetical protein